MTGNEIERRDSTIDSWAQIFAPLVRLAEHVHDTEFVPRALRGNAPATAAAMLYGRELGMGPMRSLQTVHVVDGRPTLAAEQMRAMVLAAGHELSYRETTRARCVVAGRRTGASTPTVVEWSMHDARDAGLAGKPNWRKMPRQMLVARATAELCRMIFADVIGGASATEEIADGGVLEERAPIDDISAGQPNADAKPRATQRKTPVRAQISAQPQPEPSTGSDTEQPQSQSQSHDSQRPPLPGEDDDEQTSTQQQPAQSSPNTDDETVSDTQLRKLHTVFSEHEIHDRDEKLRIARAMTDRAELTSSTELTKAEASLILDTFTRLETQAGDDFPSALDALIDEHEQLALDIARDAETPQDQESNA